MRILLVGGGGREAAIAHSLSKSPKLDALFISPGSDALKEWGDILPKMTIEEMQEFVRNSHIDLVIFGGETELVEGYADPLRALNIPVLGASKAAAQLEGSKDFLKSVLFSAQVPCAMSQSFTNLTKAQDYLETRAFPIVLKTDGLAGGKGVVICENVTEAQDWVKRYLSGEAFGEAGQTVLIEDFLTGLEVSFFVLVDEAGEPHSLASARDHKRIFDNDQGANTGGMGAFTPVKEWNNALQDEVMKTIIRPSLEEMQKRKTPFSGFLFAGLMLTDSGPKLLEYNVRLGDPETQVILQKFGEDFLDIAYEAASGALNSNWIEQADAREANTTRVNVVLAAEGYPENPKKGARIHGLSQLHHGKDYFHAGTKQDDAGDWIVNGGRVLNILGEGQNLTEARKNAYAKIDKIQFEGQQFRKDIGTDEG